jgi:hypothetical protein
MPTSFKVELLKGTHNFTASTGDVFKVALLTAAASGSGTYGAATTNYTQLGSDELPTGGGYTRPGITLTNITPVANGTSAVCDFADVTWTAATFTTCGAIIYNSTDSGAVCAVISFNGDQQVSSGNFTLQFPVAAASTAIIRIA